MQTVIERPAALDVHKASVTACVRVPSGGGVREQHVEEFAATVRGLLSLRDWLAAFGVTHVAMEASGVYWKSPWAILEDEFDCVLVNARHVKQVPGRKTDVGDAEWLCRLVEAGLLRANFVPPKTSCVNLLWLADGGWLSSASRSARAGRPLGDSGAGHPLGGSEVGHWARLPWDGHCDVAL